MDLTTVLFYKMSSQSCCMTAEAILFFKLMIQFGSVHFTSLYYIVRETAVRLIEKYLWQFPLSFLSVIILFT